MLARLARRSAGRPLLELGLALSLAAGVSRAAEIPPGHLAALDGFADPFAMGHFGATFDVDPLAAAQGNASALASSGQLYLASDLAFRPDRSIVVVDRDADPSGLGADANGDPGCGALFTAGPVDQALALLSDGSDFPAGLPPPARSVFVDPRGVDALPDGRILVADTDADPSGLGPDLSGFAGCGALFAVSPAGTVTLVSDGTISSDGPPPLGQASWLQDPGAVLVTRGGAVYVLDIYGDPRGVGARGAVFAVDLATGSLRLVGTSPQLRAPVGMAELADGDLLISDQLLDLRGDGSRGALLRLDLGAADPLAAIAPELTDPRFRGPGFLGAAPDGSVFVADSFADPLGLGRIGAVFRMRDDGLTLASASTGFLALSSVRVAPPTAPAPAIATVSPPALQAGEGATLALGGTGFAAGAEIRAGAGVTVIATRILSDAAAEADVVADTGAAPGPRDVVLTNPDLQASRAVGALEIQERTRPLPASIAPGAGIQGTVVSVTIAGQNFQPGATLELGPGIVVSGASVPDPSTLVADLDIDPAAATGPRDVVVTNPDLLAGSLVGGFEVLPPAPPSPLSATPPLFRLGEETSLLVDGTGFTPGMTLDLGAGIHLGAVTVESPFRARATVHVGALAATGPRDLTATNPDLRSGTLAGGVTVAVTPALRLVGLRVDDVETDTGNANAALEPGEIGALDVTLRNVSAVPAVSLGLRLVDPNPGLGLTIRRAVVPFPDLAAGVSARRAGPPLPEVEVDASVPCGASLPLDVEVLSGAAVIATFRVDLRIGRIADWARKPSTEGDTAGGKRGNALALADVDGDGVADLVVGAPTESPGGQFAAGRVLAISGATDDELWSLAGTEIGGLFGSALAAIGDVDGDGAEDLLVGAPGESGQAGRVHLVSGSGGARVDALAGAGGEKLGAAIASLGRDLDGTALAIVGAPAAASDAGRAEILELPALASVARIPGVAGERLGSSLAGVGDVDDDGVPDAAIGAPDAGGGAGRLVLWRSASASLAVAGSGTERLGSALAGGADLDFDGVPDLAVGAPSAGGAGTMAGRVDLLSGATLALIRPLPGEVAADELGSALAFTADVDGDGVPEIAAGAPGAGGGDGLVELRSGADGRAVGSFEPVAGESGRFGDRIASGADAGGDAFGDLLVGEPRRASASAPLAGRALALKTLAACAPIVPCLPDALEPNGLGAPAAATYGDVPRLTICRDDLDAFTLTPPVDRRMLIRIAFTHALGDLDATLHDASGALVDSSLSVDDDEEIGPVGPGGTWELRIVGFEGARNTYALSILDPDSCPPLQEIEDLRVAHAGARAILSWTPSTDRCHATPPAQGYVVWSAPTPRPNGPGPFPAGTSFTDASTVDQDADLSNERFLDDRPGPLYYLVADRGRAGEVGPSGLP